jgi:hypothetical protein
MATILEIKARIHALWGKGDTRTPDEEVELGRLLTALETEMPPGDFYTHVLEVLHIPTRDAQRLMTPYRTAQEAVMCQHFSGQKSHVWHLQARQPASVSLWV